MIREAVEYLQYNLIQTGLFSKAWGLCDLINKDGKTYPAFYKGNGEYEDVSLFDRNDGTAYIRKISDIALDKVTLQDITTSCGKLIKYSIRLRVITVIKKTKLASDSPYASDIFAEIITLALQNTSGLGAVLNAQQAVSEVVSYDTNGHNILRGEYQNPSINEFNLKYSYMATDILLTILKDKDCVDNLCSTIPTGCLSVANSCDDTIIIPNATYSGDIDGSNQTFTTPVPYAAGKLMIYFNGNRQREGIDYTETSSTTFNLTFIPVNGDNLIVDFIRR